jgi:hypothetical protein
MRVLRFFHVCAHGMRGILLHAASQGRLWTESCAKNQGENAPLPRSSAYHRPLTPPMAPRSARALLRAVAAACVLACVHARSRAALALSAADGSSSEGGAAATHAAAHGGSAASASFATATLAEPVQKVAPGIYRASYRLPLRPLRPGEVLITQAGSTLLGRPPGRIAVLDWHFDLLDSAGRPAPLRQLYNHHVRSARAHTQHQSRESASRAFIPFAG